MSNLQLPTYTYALGPEEDDDTLWVTLRNLKRQDFQLAERHVSDERRRRYLVLVKTLAPCMENGETLGRFIERVQATR